MDAELSRIPIDAEFSSASLLEALANSISCKADDLLGVAIANEGKTLISYAYVLLTRRGVRQVSRPIEDFSEDSLRFWSLVELRMKLYRQIKKLDNPNIRYVSLEDSFQRIAEFLQGSKCFFVDYEQSPCGNLAVLVTLNCLSHSKQIREYIDGSRLVFASSCRGSG